MFCLSRGSVSLGFNRSSRIGSILFVLAFFRFSSLLLCQSQVLTPAEKLVVSQVAQANPANLNSQVLSDAFIEKLLSGGFKNADPAHNMDVHGISVSHAVFEEPVNIDFEVPYRVRFSQCEFRKGVDFSESLFDKALSFDGSSFGTAPTSNSPASEDSDQAILFINATVNGIVSFNQSTFHAPVDFTKAHVKELHIENATFKSAGPRDPDPDDPDLDLTAARVESDLSLSVPTAQARTAQGTITQGKTASPQAALPGQVEAQFLSVGGSASFGQPGAGFYATKDFDLTYSHFQNLDIYGFEQWRTNPQEGAVSLDGFSFEEIYFPDSEKTSSAWRMLDLLDSPQVNYSTQPYLMLEQNLTATGHLDSANDAYIRMRNRQRRQRVQNAKNTIGAAVSARSAWLGDWIVYLLIGYGREPWRAVLVAMGFIVLGMFIFDPGHVIPQDGNDKSDQTDANKKGNTPYSRFWYSLDVLAPAIELGADKAWQPDPDWWFGRNYSYIHRIVGWILVPLILAAITGVIH